MTVSVKLLIDEDGDADERNTWHLSVYFSGSPTLFCTGEVYGQGEGNAEGVERTRVRGGVTCEDCLNRIREIKAVRI